MLPISTADILKVVLPTVITLFIAVVKTPFRIRREKHDKLLKLLESVEKPQSAPIRLLRFRDYIGNRSAGLAALQLLLLLALPDSVAALERYRFTGGRQQILRATPAGFVLRPSADSKFKRFLLSGRYFLLYLLFVTLLVLLLALAQWGLRGVEITTTSITYLPGAHIGDGWQLLFLGLLFTIIMLSLVFMIFRQLMLAGNLSSESAFYRYYQQAREEQRCRELLRQMRDVLCRI
ncbi:hypothetical protein L8N14_009470 [Serratia marcescens]|uniref:hypothetical protein n=1 Tax=Serratia marcescens TaxID=615 RepID=UPI001C93AFA7|nr:hypothetical protein [Serratia marcescens]MBY4851548.1 hypothetical protein [Serratia marcescens]MCH9866297.1 hypothetical protein [Serratia marcescens]